MRTVSKCLDIKVGIAVCGAEQEKLVRADTRNLRLLFLIVGEAEVLQNSAELLKVHGCQGMNSS